MEVNDLHLVIDTGPDFRQQMLREQITQLDAVIFTHAHRDHTAGLDDVRAYNFLQKKDMPVYGTDTVLEQLRREYSYAFSKEGYPGAPRIDLIEIDEEPFTIDSTSIIPLPVKHLHLPVFGYRINNFSYITDANFLPEETMQKLAGTKVLVINALQREEHISHFNLEQALHQVQIIKPERAYFTHMSHKLGRHSDITKELPEGVLLAFDGLQIEC